MINGNYIKVQFLLHNFVRYAVNINDAMCAKSLSVTFSKNGVIFQICQYSGTELVSRDWLNISDSRVLLICLEFLGILRLCHQFLFKASSIISQCL